MFVGVGRLVIQIPGAQTIKDRRRVVKSFKDRVRAKLPVSVAEVGDTERLQVATLGIAVVSNETGRCHEIMASALAMARVLPDAVLCDVRTEVVPFGVGGGGLASGIERTLDNDDGEDADDAFSEDWKRP
jgi:uncharacterized protein YlxP (DUF503 family)